MSHRKYKVQYGNKKYTVYQNDSKCIPAMAGPFKHRTEVETYLRAMSDPTVTVQLVGKPKPGLKIRITVSFTPFPENIATWIAEGKTTFFQIVRNAKHSYSKYKKNGHKATKHSVQLNFPYTWDYSRNNRITIVNDAYCRNWRKLTKEELMSGTIIRDTMVRDASYFEDFSHFNGFKDKKAEVIDSGGVWYHQFYIGIIYFGRNNKPAIYKMAKYNQEITSY